MTRKPANSTFDSSNTRHNAQMLLEALKTPHTHAELCAACFLTRRSLGRYLAFLRASQRRVRICGYRMIGSRHHRVYELGTAPDVPIPKQDEKKRNAKRRAKVKADPELLLRLRLYEKARWLVKKPRPAQSWLSALMP